METLTAFRALGLTDITLRAIKDKGFETPSPIQAAAIPLLLTGTKDIIGQAQTGTGKTAAFALPLIEMANPGAGRVQALVLTPTRELALQVSEEFNALRGKKKLRIVPVYGGSSMGLQLRHLREGADIVVGTPGRVLDHLSRGTLDLSGLCYLVLDEADEMLDMGFIEDMEEIMRKANPERRTVLFSATMPANILAMAKKYMKPWEHIAVAGSGHTVKLTDQIYYEVREQDKVDALCRIIDSEEDFYGLVFCRTKVDTDRLTRTLQARGYDVEALHGEVTQDHRERILRRFKDKTITILAATDVASRGIDVSNVSHVINFALPQDPDGYIHRIGRTGRAGKKGTAVTFVTPSEYRKLMYIQRAAKTVITRGKLPAVADIIRRKKDRIASAIKAAVLAGAGKPYREWATELGQAAGPEELVSALLAMAYHTELDDSGYAEIHEIRPEAIARREHAGPRRDDLRHDGPRRDGPRRDGPRRDGPRNSGSSHSGSSHSGAQRLSLSLGRADGMTVPAILSMIKHKGNLTDREIDGLSIGPSTTYLTIPAAKVAALTTGIEHAIAGRVIKVASEGHRTSVSAPGQRFDRSPHKPWERRERKRQFAGKPSNPPRPA